MFALLRTRRSADLERRLEALEREVVALRRAAPAPSSEAPPARPAPAEPPPAPDVQRPPPSAPRPRLPLPPPPPRPASPRGPQLRLPEIDWERWVGVRGAAVLGGIVLALAGVYFFQYSIEHGLIPPWLRVVVGTAVGVACIAVAELRARRRYVEVANALAGGGFVVLYAAFWASRALYGLVDTPVAFVLMVSVTAACTALAHRHASLVIAMIGLVGGFATPALLASGEDRPIALFAYILLLDGCLLFIARARGWPILALLSLLGTLAYQAIWIGGRMGADQLLIAIGVLGIFALAYGYALRTLPAEGRRQWLVTQAGAALFPFLFSIYLASVGRLEEHIFPIALLLALLSASACWIARVQERAWLGLASAAATTGVMAVQLLGRRFDTGLAWEASALCLLLAAVYHVFAFLDREKVGSRGPGTAAIASALGLLVLLIAASLFAGDPPWWPWLAGWVGLTALLLHHGGLPSRERLQPIAAAGLLVGIVSYRISRDLLFHPVDFAVEAGVVLLLAVALQLLAIGRRRTEARRFGERAAALFSLLALVSLCVSRGFDTSSVQLALGTASGLGVLALLAASRMPSGPFALAATLLTAVVHTDWSFSRGDLTADSEAGLALALQAATAAFFAFWPFLVFARLRGERFAWYAAALAGPAFFLSLRALYEGIWGPAAIGLLPVALAGLALACAVLAARMRLPGDPRRTSNLVWFLGVALGFATLAIPLQLDKAWITLGWALEGMALLWLWQRFDHPGLKYFALALFAGVTLRLVVNEAVLGYYARPSVRIVNWLLYTYLVPAAAMLAGARFLKRHELARVRDFERSTYRRGQPWAASLVGLEVIAIVFVWINLAIADWFSTGSRLEIRSDYMPARDLATSIAWALYALVLLALGVRGRSRALRWLSLALILTATLKVFLHDLGELHDLYRVASLLGLAASLIAISLAYQRFVVRREPAEES